MFKKLKETEYKNNNKEEKSMKKLIAVGFIILFLGLYFVVGLGSVFAEDSIQASYIIEERR